jgi:hypothetical protein
MPLKLSGLTRQGIDLGLAELLKLAALAKPLARRDALFLQICLACPKPRLCCASWLKLLLCPWLLPRPFGISRATL